MTGVASRIRSLSRRSRIRGKSLPARLASRLAACAAALALAGAGPSARAQDPPVFQSETALMEVEVRVADGKGNAVSNLLAEDFHLSENGKPQRIATFEFVPPYAPADTAAGTAAEVPLPAAGPTTAEAALRRGTFIYIATRGRREDTLRIYEAVRRFIDEELAPGVFVSLEGSAFTSSRKELYQQLDEMLARGSGRALIDTLAVDLAREVEYDDSFETLLEEANDEFDSQVEEIADRAALYRRLRMYEYIDLIRALSVFPGRKIVVLFSTGLPVDEDNIDVMKVLEDEATRARVRFFVSDVSRLSAAPPGGDAESAGSLPALFGDAAATGFESPSARRQDSQDGLYELARRTGGRAVLNSNDFGEVFDVVERETGSYYLLGYYPSDTEQRGRLRRIRVRVEGRGLRVSHQRGYYEERPFAETSRDERNLRMHQALAFDTPYADLPIVADFEFFRDSRGLPTLVYSVGLHVRDIPHSASRKGETLKLTVVAQASGGASADGRRAPPVIDDKRFEITVPAERLRSLSDDPNAWLHYGSQMPLAPGSYDWKVVVRDDLTGAMGSYQTPIEVPEFRSGAGASSLLLTGRIVEASGAVSGSEKNAGREGQEDVLHVAGSRFFASAVKKFRRGDLVYALFDVYGDRASHGADPPPPKIALYRGSEAVSPLPVEAFQAVPEPESKRTRYLAAFATADLPAGSYTVAAMLSAPDDRSGAASLIHRRFEILEPGAE